MYGIASPVWPLAREPAPWTAGGSFGAARDSGTRLHQGIDLYAPEGTAVIAAEDGIVTGSQGWSGPNTKGLWVYSPQSDISILYGAVAPGSYPSIGTTVTRGSKIASIGRYPAGSTLLHLEVWPGKQLAPRPRWNPGDDPPSYDPAEYLERAKLVWTLIPGLLPDPQGGGNQPVPKPQSGGSGGGGAVLAIAALAGLYFATK